MSRDAIATEAHARFSARDAAGALACLVGPEVEADAGLLVLRAHCRARTGGDPHPDLALALTLAPEDASLRARAARLLVEASAPVEALEQVEVAARLAPGRVDVELLRAEVLRLLGRSREAFELLVAAHMRAPTAREVTLRLARLALSAWTPELAEAPLATTLLSHPDDAELLDLAAEVAVSLRRPHAQAAVAAAAAASPERGARAVERLVELGEPEAATRLLEELRTRTPSPQLDALAAHLLLLRGQVDAAGALADAALGADPGCSDALVVRGAVAVLRGDPAAPTWLDRAITGPARARREAWLGPDAALAWRAEGWWRAGQAATAFADAREALALASPYHLPAHLLTMLVGASPTDVDPGDGALDDAARLALARSRMPPAERIWSSWGHHAYPGCAELLAQLGHDRTRHPTIRGTTTLLGLAAPPYPRHLTRALQQALRVRSPEDVLARFEALQAVHPEDPTLHTYQGETLLWLGRYAEARDAFDRARQRFDRATWAWIGRGAAELMLGFPEDALATFARGVARAQSEGPSIYVYRGEAAWRLGRLDDARRDLQTAVRRHPRRAAAWVLLARLELADGRPERAAAVITALRRTAPGLVADVREADPTTEPDAWLAAVLHRMRGNRSSTVLTWIAADGSLRFLQWAAPARGAQQPVAL